MMAKFIKRDHPTVVVYIVIASYIVKCQDLLLQWGEGRQ